MQTTRDPISRAIPLSVQVKQAPPEQTALLRHAQSAAARWRTIQPAVPFRQAPRFDKLPAEGPARNWIVENIRLLHTSAREVDTAVKSLKQQPFTDGGVPRSYAVATSYLDATGLEFSEATLEAYLAAAQEACELQMQELWAIKPMLQLALLERVSGPDVAQAVTSLRAVSEGDWNEIFDATNIVDPILRRDPAGAYARMDRDSRELYRLSVADLARHSSRSETEISSLVVDLAAQTDAGSRQHHVGYFLIDDGLPGLRHQIEYRPPFWGRVETLLLNHAEGYYLVCIEMITMLIMFLLLSRLHQLAPILSLLFLLPLPASQAAVELINTITTSLLRPRRLARLDFSASIPPECATMVAIPSLLLEEKQVSELVADLEIRYLANRGPNIFFALLTDTPDSAQAVDEKDELVSLAVKSIEDLNARYAPSGPDPFYLLHRHRVFNASENAWMGWERKRGKLLDLNKLLRGEFDSFPVKAGDVANLPRIRFVITLDSDTQLPRDSAHRLIGTMAHPLNRPVIDPATNMVVAGYGILQPRVGVSIQSAQRSRLANLYSGETGFDIYTRAISDIYQDLFGEAIFTGKGIYDVDALQTVLDNRFPINALLSHDLIEGAYARVALVSEIEVIDDYPSRFSAYSRRKHRWVRGDWQITRWLLPRVPDFHRRKILNPISLLSRWKIVDNLRRSLFEPAMLALLLAGWFYLPGGPKFWTLMSMALLLLSTYANLAFSLLRRRDMRTVGPFLKETAKAFARNHAAVFLFVAFLLHQSLTTLDAIVRTLIRSNITHRNLLEWETAAQAETGSKRTPVDFYLDLTPWLSLLLTFILSWYRPEAAVVALPFLLAWATSKALAKWMDRPAQQQQWEFRDSSYRLLRATALRTWRYFRVHSTPENHWLIPDNVQESPTLIAERISPTNLGFLLNARQAAWEMGYLTLPEMVRQTAGSLGTVERLSRFHGHFLNWYDTSTLEPLDPPFVSTVDSGNLAASLWTLEQGCLAMIDRPLLQPSCWQGLRDHVDQYCEATPASAEALRTLVDSYGQDTARWLNGLDTILQSAVGGTDSESAWWAEEIAVRVRELRDVVESLCPWRLPRHASLYEALGQPLRDRLDKASLATLPGVVTELETVLSRLEWNSHGEPDALDSLAPLEASLMPVKLAAIHLQKQLRELAAIAARLVDEMDFRFLYQERRKLLSIGYHADTGQLARSSYDLLASESRTSSFIAIAKQDVPQEHWFHLGRSLTGYLGERLLLSWTGTMFEYLMPSLWMRSYPNTILDESMRAAISVQQRYAKREHWPWGISESAHALQNDRGDYQYHAFGLTPLALRPEVSAPRVVSPYSSILALPFDPAGSVPNLYAFQTLGAFGRYGFYEALDYTSNSSDPALVKCWMAHHQGMSLLAIANLLLDSPFTRYFHAAPQVMATELLLHEKVPHTIPIDPPPAVAHVGGGPDQQVANRG